MNRPTSHKVIFLAALGMTSCAASSELPAEHHELIMMDRTLVRNQIVADTVRNRFTSAFEKADKEFSKLYDEDNDR